METSYVRGNYEKPESLSVTDIIYLLLSLKTSLHCCKLKTDI